MRPTKGERFLEAFTDIDDKYLKEAMNYTMKKRFNFKPIIAVAACAALALAAVPVVNHFVNTPGVENPDNGNDTIFTVYESGAHDSTTIGNHKIELELNSEREIISEKNKVGSQKTITLNGLEWTGVYKTSLSKTDYNEPVDKYVGTSNGKNVTFMVNSVTGKCEYFFVDTRGETEDRILTRDELYKIAYEIFINGDYTDDPENYTLVYEGSSGDAYWFNFSRFVDGIQTCDVVRLYFNYDGTFSGYMGNRVGEMKDFDASDINMDKLYEAVEAKLKAIYADAYVGFDKKGAVLTKLTDGSYIFKYGVDTTVKNDKGEVILDRCYLTVLIDK